MPSAIPSLSELVEVGHAAGLDVVGVSSAEPFAGTRRDLETRKAAGLHGGMQFTYRNPARATDPQRSLPGARALVVAARSYRRGRPTPTASASDGAGPHGQVARYSWRDHYAPLRAGLDAVAEVLVGRGWQARVLVDDNALVDRAAAVRAGLGWYGKNTVVLVPGEGSWFVLGSVVTDAPLAASGQEPVPDGCGPCRRCLDSCPTGALVEPGVLDARRCLAWLLEAPGSFPLEHRVALGARIYGCDDCQEVCPPNRLVDRRHPAAPAERDSEAEIDLVALVESSDEEILDRVGRWYIPGRQPRYVRRNALVALGNVGDGRDRRTTECLRRAATDPDPIVREHAVWAAHQLGRDDLGGPPAGLGTDAA